MPVQLMPACTGDVPEYEQVWLDKVTIAAWSWTQSAASNVLSQTNVTGGTQMRGLSMINPANKHWLGFIPQCYEWGLSRLLQLLSVSRAIVCVSVT
ncbi:hypothetical protein MHYP_G00127930 [Metynnis hypsauchen]